MSIQKDIIKGVENALQTLYGATNHPLVQLQKTRKEFRGDFTVNVFPFLKIVRKSPEQAAAEIGDFLLNEIEAVHSYEVVKGFLNLYLKDTFWADHFRELSADRSFGTFAPDDKTVMVEYSSPNTNKPLHLGHLRNNFLGYSVSEILKANGHNVIKTQIINDRGIHICKSMLAWQKWGNGETPESSGMKGDHLVGKYYVLFDKAYKKEIAELMAGGMPEEEAKKKAPILLEAQDMLRRWEAKDPEVMQLWKRMNGWVYEGFDKTYDMMGVDFDKLYYESETYLKGREMVMKGLEKGVFYRKDDGSVWVDLSDEGLDQKLLLRSDGTAVYMTQDIGTAAMRYEDYPMLNQLIYTVGNEQDYHFKVLFLILDKLGYDWAKACYHLSYGMVELPHGKMKSREGTVVDADDLMAQMVQAAAKESELHGHAAEMSEDEQKALARTIGIGAIKYFILKVDPKKKMLFDPQASIDLNGNTAPFIQYAYARIRSIMRRAENVPLEFETPASLEPKERELIKLLAEYPEHVKEAGDKYSPAVLANYAYDLVKAYNSFYQSIPIFNAESEQIVAFRVKLSETTGQVIKKAMRLLGIDVPEKM